MLGGLSRVVLIMVAPIARCQADLAPDGKISLKIVGFVLARVSGPTCRVDHSQRRFCVFCHGLGHF